MSVDVRSKCRQTSGDITNSCRVCAKKLGKGVSKTNAKYLQNDIFVLCGQNVALDSPHVPL